LRLCIRAHDLGVKGSEAILSRLDQLGLDGVQMVCYKAYDDIAYDRGAITPEIAGEIGRSFSEAGAVIPLIGAYFNPVHSDKEKVSRCFDVFADYIRNAKAMGCSLVGSETGSFNDDKWTYHPLNRTDEALETVADTFSRLCDIGAEYGVDIAMEGAAGHVCWNVAALDSVQRKIGKDNLKVIFDLYNYLDETNQFEYLEILDEGLRTFAGRIKIFHMKDCVFDKDGKPRQVPFGTGEMDIGTVLSKIKAYDENATLVLEGTAGEDILFAVECIRKLW